MAPATHELAAVGVPPAAALMLGQQLVTGVSAAGTTQVGATLLKAGGNRVDTVAANSGVRLPLANGQPNTYVFNNGANVLTIYPAVGQNFIAVATNTGVQILPGKGAVFFSHDTTWGAIISA